MKALSPRRWWVICFLLVGTGFTLSTYLTVRALELAGSHAPGSFDLCSALFRSSCDATLADPRHWFLRIPLAGWGPVYFTALGGLLFLARFTRGAFETEALLAGSLIAALGSAAGIGLSAWALLGGEPVCPACFSVHAISLLLLSALRRAGARSVLEDLATLRAAAAWLLRSGTEPTERARWNLVAFASVALLSAFAYQWVYVESALRRPPVTPAPSRDEVIAAYRATPRVELPVTAEDPRMGELTAPVRLVVFESFRCPACRLLAGTLSKLRDEFGDRVVVVYKHYPLSTECNHRLSRDMQPGACEIAWAAEAANRQARFWPFHDAIFASGANGTRGAIAEAVRRASLDPARFEADRASASTTARVAEDIALGDRLKIPGTPTVFIDGRLVPSPGPKALEILIRYQLGRQVAGSQRGSQRNMDAGRPVRPSQGG